MNHELPDVQACFRKGRGTRDQIANICWIIKKAKWLSGEALQIAMKRKEVKSKGEKERYKHLNAEFQRIARRDKKATERKTTEWERLGTSLRKLEIPREHFMQRWAR